MLKGFKVTKYFGGLVAVKDVDFEVRDGEVVGLIGPNGAGKTTLFNCINGIYRPTSGTIKFRGRDITRLKSHEICKLGIARSFQIVKPFLSLTALKNVTVGCLYGKAEPTSLSDAEKKAVRYLEFVGLIGKKNVPARSLTLIDRKKLGIARALATDPKIILLDEVMAGLNPTETIDAMGMIGRIRDELGITIFWVEHVMRAIMGVAERIIVLHHGMKIAEGSPKEVTSDPKVADAYLGEKYIL